MAQEVEYNSWVKWKAQIKEKKLSDSLKETSILIKEGLTISEIAKKREFKKESIEKHIIDLIAKSFLWPGKIIGEEKFKHIFKRLDENNLTSLKKVHDEVLEKRFSYFEIKCVLAYLASLPQID